MDPNTISNIVGISGQLFRFSFPALVLAIIIRIVAGYVSSMATWIPTLEVLIWVLAALCTPFTIIFIIVAVSVWWAYRG